MFDRDRTVWAANQLVLDKLAQVGAPPRSCPRSASLGEIRIAPARLPWPFGMLGMARPWVVGLVLNRAGCAG